MPTSPFLLHHLRRLLSSPPFYLREAFTFHKFRTLVLLVPKIFCFGHLVTAYVGYEALTHGPSMLPTLAGQGDRVFISAHFRHGRDVAVGDLVSFKHPCVPGTEAVKRVAGMPGDFVLRDTLPEGRKPSGRETMLQVPEGHCWVLGDNLTESRDSRTYGPLPLGLVMGKVVAKLSLGQGFRWIENGLARPEAAA